MGLTPATFASSFPSPWNTIKLPPKAEENPAPDGNIADAGDTASADKWTKDTAASEARSLNTTG
jgi:hypothetical protein